MKIIGVEHSHQGRVYLIGEEEGDAGPYHLMVRPAESETSLRVHAAKQLRYGQVVPLKGLPACLVPFALQVLEWERVSVKEGPFGGEASSGEVTSESALETAVERALGEDDLALGAYPTGSLQGDWFFPGDEGWDADEYRETVEDAGDNPSLDELRFRIMWGRSFFQDEITQAILRVLRRMGI
jgi:hypothetical protein